MLRSPSGATGSAVFAQTKQSGSLLDELEAESAGMIAKSAFVAFAVLMLLTEQNTVIVTEINSESLSFRRDEA